MSVTDPKFNPSGLEGINAIKNAALVFENVIKENSSECRRQSLAITHLEIASMFAVKACVAPD